MTTELAVPEEPDTSTLNLAQKAGAYYDAQGRGPSEIAGLVGVHEKTISTWRRDPRYLAERARWVDTMLDKIEPMLQRARALHLAALHEVNEMLREAVQATDSEGRPVWSTRVAAAKALIDHPITKALFAAAELAADRDREGGNSVVHLHIHGDEVEVVEGEAVEVPEA